LAAAFLVWVFLFRTRFGYELRAVGLAPKAAAYAGASIARNTVTAMALSGALAGLTATHYVLGGALEDYSLRQSIPTGDGFDGIAVALLGANHPVGVVLAAFLFGVLKNGGSTLNIAFSDLTRDVVSMILALVVLFIAAKGFLPDHWTNPLRRAQALGELPDASPPEDRDARAQGEGAR
jgi:general nucleoside transport system permease protein